MKTQLQVHWHKTIRFFILLATLLALSNALATTQALDPQKSIPDDFELVIAKPAVELYRDAASETNYVQVVDLDNGAVVKLLHGSIESNEEGPYGGDNPSFERQSLQNTWDEFSMSDNNAFCITNGQFFSTDENPAPLAFSLKSDGVIVSDGYAVAGDSEEYPGQKLMLEIWDDRADIVPLTMDGLYNSDAPNIIAGLTEDADKGPDNEVGRTFIGLDDANDDGLFEVFLILNSSSSTQPAAADVLRSFGADKVMMLDGGGSTQLICNNEPHIPSSRTIPQTIAVSSANDSTGTVDVAIIIDSSGSMTQNDSQNKRLVAAQAYLSGSLAGDYVGIVDFDDGVRLASPLLLLPDNKETLIDAINTINSSGGTNIGMGIEEGCEALINSFSTNNTKAAILLTDGQGSYNDQSSCFIARDWPIYTFGFGSANDVLLQEIADGTGGEYARLPTSDFVCEFQRVRSKIAGVEPGPCYSLIIGPLEISIIIIPVPPGQQQISFSTSWTGSDVEMKLISPSGRIIDRNTVAPDVIHDFGANFEIYTILSPEPGDWEVSLFGADVPPEGEEVVFGFTNIPSDTKVVNIDIEPGTEPNRINPAGRGTVQVAILSESDFDATLEVNRNSLTFGQTGIEDSLRVGGRDAIPRCFEQNVNNDGFNDLVCHFIINKMGFELGDTVGILRGETINGVPIEGTDSVIILSRNR